MKTNNDFILIKKWQFYDVYPKIVGENAFPITNKNEWERYVEPINYRSFKDWRYAYAQPGEQFYEAHSWTSYRDDGKLNPNQFYRYVTVEGKFVKLHMIIER